MESTVHHDHSFAVPPLDSLRAALAAWHTGSFSAAANTLSLTHGAVSRRVAMVEAWAGFPLFVRHGRGVRPTSEGERLLMRIEAAFITLTDGVRLSALDPDLEQVRVSVTPSFARLWLLPNLRTLEGNPADLRVIPEADARFAALSDTRIAVRYGSGNWPGVSSTLLFSELLVPVARLDLVSQISVPCTADMLRHYPLIHIVSDSQWHRWHNAQGEAFVPDPRDRYFDDYDLALRAAAEGLGIALLPVPFGESEAARLGLQPLSDVSTASGQGFYIVCRAGRRSATIDRLADRMLKATDAIRTR